MLIKDSRVEDIYFKSVETLPPKFTNIQTIVTATDSLVGFEFFKILSV